MIFGDEYTVCKSKSTVCMAIDFYPTVRRMRVRRYRVDEKLEVCEVDCHALTYAHFISAVPIFDQVMY